MEKLIISVLFVIFAAFSLGKTEGKKKNRNNYFTTLCVVTTIVAIWVFSSYSEVLEVVALYATLCSIVIINWIKRRDYIISLLVIRKPRHTYQREKAARLSDTIRNSLIFSIVASCAGAAYIMIENQPQPLWDIIAGTAGVLALVWAIALIKEFLDEL